MNCKCISEINARLKAKNLNIVGFTFLMPDFESRITIETDWIDYSKVPRGSKKNPPPMLASYCPFCGKKVVAVKIVATLDGPIQASTAVPIP